MNSLKLLAVGAAILVGVAGVAKADTLGDVQKRGALNCGVNGPTGLTGFGIPDDQGHWRGLDVDVCRAVASAIFGDDTKVKYVPLGSKERFTALQSGEIDLLVRNSTWTFSRENDLGLEFVAVNYYDGQGFMVRKELGVDSALKLSGAIQAARWTQLTPELGYVYSFNGPHSLFSDAIRSMRALVVAHQLGHKLMGEGDEPIDLLRRALQHAAATARYNVYYGTGRDSFDIRGRVVHESIFNLSNRAYRCPSTQQGYSPFTTWTRGQAWILCGYAEQLEFLQAQPESSLASYGGKRELLQAFEAVASAVASFWLEYAPVDGIPYWDTGAPNLHRLGDWASRPSDPFNDYEPVDSSAAAIAAQGLLRYGNYLNATLRQSEGAPLRQAAFTIARHLFAEPYLSTASTHQGLILHSIYHQPNGWDHKQAGQKIANGESSMWGDYHARELALMIQREAKAGPYYQFF